MPIQIGTFPLDKNYSLRVTFRLEDIDLDEKNFTLAKDFENLIKKHKIKDMTVLKGLHDHVGLNKEEILRCLKNSCGKGIDLLES